MKKSKRGFLWVTLMFFLLSFAGHWAFGWFEYKNEQAEKQQQADVGGYLVQISRDTLENWQSEFLQLMWQVAGLSFLLYIGSPQSKEGDERKEEKIDAILRALDPERAKALIRELDAKYPRQ